MISPLPPLRGLIPAPQVHTPTRAPAAQASAATPSKLSARAPAKLVGSAAAPAKRLHPPDPGSPEAAPAKRRRPLADPAQAARAPAELVGSAAAPAERLRPPDPGAPEAAPAKRRRPRVADPRKKLAKWMPFLPLRPGVTQSWLGLRRSADGRAHFGRVLCAQHRGENCRDALARFAVPPSQARLPNLRRHGETTPHMAIVGAEAREASCATAPPPEAFQAVWDFFGGGAAPRLSAVDEEEIHDGVVCFQGPAGLGARHAGQVRHHQHRDV